jgi:hypothetical protein
MDLTASFLRIAGVKSLQGLALDGLDVLQHVQDGLSDFERPLFWRARRGDRTWRAVRVGDLKYVRRVDQAGDVEWLFDLAKDPGESSNLMETAPVEANRLKGLLSDWEREVRPVR